MESRSWPVWHSQSLLGLAPRLHRHQLVAQRAPATTPAAVTRTTVEVVFGDNPPDDQIVLNEVELATRNLVADLIMSGQPVSDYEWTVLRSIEEVRQVLEQLEDQRTATQAIINAHIAADQPVPVFECAILESIEQARLASLARIGLAY